MIYEQVNLAFEPEYRSKLMEVRDILQGCLDTFDHPYSLEDDSFMQEDYYRRAAQYAREEGTGWMDPLVEQETGLPTGQ